MHRRDRHRSRPGAPTGLHDPRGPGHGGRHGERGHEEGAGWRPRVPPDQPPAGLPRVRQGRRVPPAGPDPLLRTRREPLRRGEAPLREADHDQRPGGARPGAMHPLRPLHAVRGRRRRRHPHPLPGPREPDPGQHLPRSPLRQLLQRQHGPDLPRGRAHRHALPVQGPPLGPGAGREHVHELLGRVPHPRPVQPQRDPSVPGRGRRPGQLGLAVRQGPVRLRVRQQRGPARPPPGPPRGRARRGALGRGAVDGC